MKTQLIGAAIVVALIFAVARSSDPAKKAARKKNKAEASATVNEKKQKQAERKAEKRAPANLNTTAPRLFETPSVTPAQAVSSAVSGSSGSVGSSAGTSDASTQYNNTLGTSTATTASDAPVEAFTGTSGSAAGSSSGSASSEAGTSTSTATATTTTTTTETTPTTTDEVVTTSDKTETTSTQTPTTQETATNNETTTASTTTPAETNTNTSTSTPSGTVFPTPSGSPTSGSTGSTGSSGTSTPPPANSFTPPVVIAPWYPFVLNDNMDSLSPANTGKLVLDAPAGKHGFLKVTNGRFVFTNGKPIQFWGTNLAIRAPFPSKKDAVTIANRVAFLGFNAVRIHNLDNNFAPFGIFKDVKPSEANAQFKTTGTIDAAQIDYMDYLIYQMKTRGIYTVIDLLVGRRFTTADGMTDADKFKPGARPVFMFDPVLIELQKTFIRNLMNHYNPYTQLRYKDDPAIAFLEIANEASVLYYWEYDMLNGLQAGQTTALPTFYLDQLNTLWNNWLQTKYSTVDAVKTAWAFTGTNNGTVINAPGDLNAWVLNAAAGTQTSLQKAGTEARISVIKATGVSGSIQFARSAFNMQTTKSYKITFTASANPAVLLNLDAKSGTLLKLTDVVSLTPTLQTFEYSFTPNKNTTTATVNFSIGRSAADFIFRDITITEYPLGALAPVQSETSFTFDRPMYKTLSVLTPQKKADIIEFYNDLQDNYFSGMSTLIKNEIGAQMPVSGMSGVMTLSDIPTLSSSDMIDFHTYWDHPDFPSGSFDPTNFVMDNTSMLQDSVYGIIGKITAKSQSVPSSQAITVTEWNHCAPNPYAFETPVFLASSAKTFPWDGVFQFSLLGNINITTKFKSIQEFFEIGGNTQQMALNPAAAYAMLKAPKSPFATTVNSGIFKLDSPYIQGAAGALKTQTVALTNLSITSSENGAVFAHSVDDQPLGTSKLILLTVVGDTKNTGSGWVNGKYNWGTTPVLMQNMPTSITITNSNILQAFTLDASGTRNTQLKVQRKTGSITVSTDGVTSPWIELSENLGSQG